MNYEKKYKEALEMAKDFYKGYKQRDNQLYANDLETIFPELCESEDEKIRKEIIKFLELPHRQFVGERCQEEWIAWLEKQGGQKSVDKEYTFKSIPRLLDMIEPTDRAKSYCKKLIDTLLQEGYVTDAKIVSDCLKQMNGEKVAMAIMDIEKQGEQKTSVVDFKAKDWYVSKVDGKIYNAKFMEKTPTNQARKLEIEKAAMSATGIIKQEEWFIKGAEWSDKNPSYICSEKQSEQKPTDEIEPKFKIGDWIVDNCGYVWKIEGILNQFYILEGVEGGESRPTIEWVNKTFHLWTIQDAKDGDVLCCETDEVEWIFIYREIVPAASEVPHDLLRYYFLLEGNYFSWNGVSAMVTDDYELYLKPATKSQRDTLFAKMKEEGYEWSEETHELKKISQRMVSAESKEALYDKPTDEEMKELLRTEYEKGRADTIAEMKLSWSEEDEKMLEGIVNIVKDVRCQSLLSEIEIYDDYIDWLKSLKDRYTWRPSNEQIDTLEHFVRSIGESGYASPYDNNTKLLYSLLEQLKKLTE